MKSVSALKYLIFIAVLVGGFGIANNKYKWLALGNNAALASACLELSAGKIDYDAFLKVIQNCIDSCEGEEAELSKEYYSVFEPISRDEKLSAQQFIRLPDILLRTIKYYEKEGRIDEMLSIYSTAIMVASTLANFGQGPADAQKIFEQVPTLPERFPDKIMAHKTYASYLSLNGGDPLQLIKVLYECLLLDSQDKYCQQGYEQTVAQYTEIRCAGADIPQGLEFFRGSVSKSVEFPIEYESNRGPIFLTKDAEIAADDIESISPGNNEYGMDEVSVIMTSAGKEKLAKVTKASIGGLLAIVFNGTVLMAANILTEIKDGRSVITSGKKSEQNSKTSLFDELCPHPAGQELPNELKL